MNIASRWLDLDRITGASEQTGPIDSIAKFSLAAARPACPATARPRATLAIDQANLGRDAVGPVQLVLMRSDDKLEIEELRVGMPGGSRGELQGTIFDAAGKPVVFDGNLALRGTSVARFLAWATGNALPVDAKADGAFGLRAQIAAGNGQVAARDIVGDLSGHRAQRRRAVSLGGPARGDARAGGPADRCARVHSGRREPCRDMSDLFCSRGPEAKQADAHGRHRPQAGWRGAQTDVLAARQRRAADHGRRAPIATWPSQWS